MTSRTKLTITAAFAVTGVAAAAAANAWVASAARRWVRRMLSERFASDVSIRSLKVAVFPRPVIRGEGLVLRQRGRPGVPPLISIARFSARTGLLALLRQRRHIRRVHIEGLHIQVPPKEKHTGNDSKATEADTSVIDDLTSENARLDIYPREPGKPPLTFLIHRLDMQDIAADRPARFEAYLINPKPKGEIHVRGKFGPWQAGDPGQTPVAASYSFTDADLNTIRGISGILSSQGRFAGVLERIEVDGTTTTPDFSVDAGRHKLALNTAFHAVVDGTTGNTLLEPVKARFLDTSVLADGGVVRDASGEGRRVTLDVTVRDGRVEDLLKFAVKGDAPLTGAISFRARFDLPPGDRDITDRLRLDGEFGISDSEFSKLDIRQKVETLSRKGQGEPEGSPAGSAVSDFRGRFVMENGSIAFPDLRFYVEGAAVHLKGAYGIKSEKLDFRGDLRLSAKVSETTKGFKSVLLKLVDPLFKKKGAGTLLPIRIEGTRSNPKFGVDKGRIFR